MEFIRENFINIISIIGFVIGILAYLDGRAAKKDAKSEKIIRNYLFDAAEKNIDKEITEDNISKLKQVESDLTSAIHEKIPLLARQISLTNSLEEIENDLLNDYAEYQTIKDELQMLGIKTKEIPKQISDIVVENILPEYYKRKKKEQNLMTIAFLFLLYIIISNIPVLSTLRFVLVFLMYKPSVGLLEVTLPQNENWSIQLKCFYGVVIGIYTLLFCRSNIDTSIFLGSKGTFSEMETSIANITWLILSILSCCLISFSIGLELKILVKRKMDICSKMDVKNKKIFYSLYYLFLIIILLVIVFVLFSISLPSIKNGYPFCGIYFKGCVICGIICLTALIVPVLPLKSNLKRKNHRLE